MGGARRRLCGGAAAELPVKRPSGSGSPIPRPPSHPDAHARSRAPGVGRGEPRWRSFGWEMAAAGLVAVAAAAEYSGPAASGGNLPAVNCGPNSGAASGPGPGSWSRSLDRALEEAAVTGVLSLSGRKLREFPRGAANHDLTDTTRAGKRGRGRAERPGAVTAAGSRGTPG